MSAEVVIHHNPACGTSRKVLAMIRDAGIEPRIVRYLETPPDRGQLLALIAATGQPARALLRRKEPLCAQLGLDAPDVTEERVVDAMLAHPILVERPIVRSPLGARLCRPPEAVLALLPVARPADCPTRDGPSAPDTQHGRSD